MRLAWATDLHFDLAEPAAIDAFVDSVHATEPDAVLLGGDVARAPTIRRVLTGLADRFGRPVYFVLGNHDYYVGSIEVVRGDVRSMSGDGSDGSLTWLPAAGVVPLTRTVALIGHGCWGDARAADFMKSSIRLNDYVYIIELSGIGQQERVRRLQALGDEAAGHLRAALEEALSGFDSVYCLTHVPPFREAAWHEGEMSDDDAAPHFTCIAAGEALREIMSAHPDKQLTVLCGHTHGAGEVDILPNLKCITGGAIYREPALQRVIEIDCGEPS